MSVPFCSHCVMVAHHMSVDHSPIVVRARRIPVPPTMPSEGELCWLGASPDLHEPPHIAPPSLAVAQLVLPQLPELVKPTIDPETYTSPTSIIYAHHHPSTSSLGTAGSLSVSLRMARRTLPRLLVPALVQLPAADQQRKADAGEPGDAPERADDGAEILPFSPVSPNPMQGYTLRLAEAQRPDGADSRRPSLGQSTFGVEAEHAGPEWAQPPSGPATPSASVAELLSRTGQAAQRARQT